MANDYLMEINDCINPSITFYYIDGNAVKASRLSIDINDNGTIDDENSVVNQISTYLNIKDKNCLVLINSDNNFNINRFYPNLNIRKSRKIYEASIKESFPNLNKYKINYCEFETGECSLYSANCFDLQKLDYYKNFALKCGFKNVTYKLKAQYLIDEYIRTYKTNTFALFYYENDLLYFSVCIKGKIIYAITALDNKESENRMTLACVDGINFELKKNVVDTIFTNRELETIADHKVYARKINKNFDVDGEKF